MSITVADRRFVLPADVETHELDGDVLVARRGSRHQPQVLSAESLVLLERFREPTTLVDAILAHCADSGGDPLATLESAFPVLLALGRTDILVPDGTEVASTLEDRHQVGTTIGPATLRTRLRTLRDSEIWVAETADGSQVVVKIVDHPTVGPDLVAHEIAALNRLRGRGAPRLLAPRLLWHEASDTGGAMVLTHVAGCTVDLAAQSCIDAKGRLRIALSVLDAYVALHARGVVHADVHPGNILVSDGGQVTLIDFGLARTGLSPAHRVAGGEYLEPEAASGETPLPQVDHRAEQYAIAAVLFRLFTDDAYLDLDTDRGEALERIRNRQPRRFVEVGADPWPVVEGVLRRALSKDPARRFGSVRELRDALRSAARFRPRAAPAPPPVLDVIDLFDVTGPFWRAATPEKVSHAAWFLQRIAMLTSDRTAHDLATVWTARSAGAAPAPAPPDSPVRRAHTALATYCRTGDRRQLAAARRIADLLVAEGQVSDAWVADDVLTLDIWSGRLAGLLLAHECTHPAGARLPE